MISDTLKYTSRIRILTAFFLLAVVVVLGRLLFWQVAKGEDLALQGRAQQQTRNRIEAYRGNIFASDGSWLVASADSWLLYASLPQVIESPYEIARKLTPLFVAKNDEEEDDDAEADYAKRLRAEEERIVSLLSKEDLVWVALKDRLTKEDRDAIEELSIAGLGFQAQDSRVYPEASAAAQLLGFVGKDSEGQSKGYFGLEGYYDQSLAGKHGFRSRESSAVGAPILIGVSRESSAISGVDLITHIDKAVQLIVEKHLADGIERFRAVSGTVIVSRPSDGAILAMASLPSYDPSKYYNFSDELFRNPAISDGFEPGSIFKPIVMAAGIDAKLITPDSICPVCHQPYKVDKYFIKTWNNQYNANATMTEVLVKSDNVGMAYIGSRLGADKLYDYLSAFGFGQITNIDLQGEVSPQLRPKGSWNIVDLATASFGQGVAVTPIQIVKAIGVIANGGKSVAPQVVDKVKAAENTQNIAPELGGQVISEEAARQVTNMMVEAVKDGEAKWAVPPGFTAAGKTGTAQIPVAGHYDAEKTISSFVGFAPPYNPEFLMLVTLRETKSSPWASETAAPLWFDIAKELYLYFGI